MYCIHCGTLYPNEIDPYPRTCSGCGDIAYANPTPVAVLLLPVCDDKQKLGLLVGRRAIEPKKGELALISGYIEVGETWQQAASREAREEVGIEIDPAALEVFDVMSTPDTHRILIFSTIKDSELALPYSVVEEFKPNREVSEVRVLFQSEDLAFGTHTNAVAAWFNYYGTKQ